MMRPLPAPRAVRTANSRVRCSPLARARLATFTQTMRRTNPTATMRARAADFEVGPSMSSRTELSCTFQPSFDSGYSAAS